MQLKKFKLNIRVKHLIRSTIQPGKIREEETQMHSQIKQLSEKYDADIYLYYGGILRDPASFLIDNYKKRYHDNAVLILITLGGDPDAAYKIVKYFHHKYANLKLIVSGFCKSAGSLIALGADEIIMGPDGELGPLDIQQGKNDELGELTSGLNIPMALESLTNRALAAFREYLIDIREGSNQQVTTKTAADVAVNLSVGLYGKIFKKIDPNALGEIERAIKIAHNYALRIQKGNLKEDCVENLVYTYPSHSFVIDYDEAQNLFKDVKKFEKEELDFFEIFPSLLEDLERRSCFYSKSEMNVMIANLNEVYHEGIENVKTAGLHGNNKQNIETAATEKNRGIQQSA